MTSRERVMKAISFEEGDKVPIDIGGTEDTGIHIDEYCDLMRYAGIVDPVPKVYDQFQMLARVEGKMREYLHTDVVQVENPVFRWGFYNRNWKQWTTFAGNTVLMPGDFDPVEGDNGELIILDEKGGAQASMPRGGKYFDRCCSTQMSAEIEHMDPAEWKKSIALYTQEELREMEENAKFLHEETTYSVHGGFGRGKLFTTGLMAGHTMTDWLCILMMEPEYAGDILDASTERTLENLELYLQAVGKYLDTILIASTDYGSQKSEIFSPDVFEELYVPRYEKMTEYVHKHSGAKTFLHSCGSVRNLIPHFIEAGIDILNPVQTNAGGMDPVELKKEFGGKIVFWGGGVESQTVLPYGTPDDVEQQVRERLKVFGPGGGFVFAVVHNIQHGVPVENLRRMLDVLLKHRDYN
jgi:uroporphyrinogen decarboxylase